MTGDPARVLIVEDDEELRALIGSALDDAGYLALEAGDGQSALAACERRDPDVILLDLGMPRLGGQAFADAYRRGSGRAKIIVMTGAERGGETSARMHAAVYLSKPFDLGQLLAAVRRVVEPATA